MSILEHSAEVGTPRRRRVLYAIGLVALLIGMLLLRFAGPETIRTYNHEFAVKRIYVASGPARLAVIGGPFILTSSLQDTAALSLVNIEDGTVRRLGVLPLERPWPRVLDMAVLRVKGPADAPTTARVLISAAVDDHPNQCQMVAVRSFDIDLTGGGNHRQVEEWFRSVCVPFAVGHNAQWESGGGLALLPDTTADNPDFYLGLGHFLAVRSDWYKTLSAADSDTIGTVVHVKVPGRFEVVSRGHRNVQGLALVSSYADPILLGTEHGPQGGDEINLILPGHDYGWPRVSMGQRYVTEYDPIPPEVEGMHPGAEPPVFYFTPSVGLGPIHVITGPAFKSGWLEPKESGLTTLLVAGMRSGTVFKLVFDGHHVVSEEPIQVNLRVRTIVEADNKLVFGTDNGQLLALTPQATRIHGAMVKIDR